MSNAPSATPTALKNRSPINAVLAAKAMALMGVPTGNLRGDLHRIGLSFSVGRRLDFAATPELAFQGRFPRATPVFGDLRH